MPTPLKNDGGRRTLGIIFKVESSGGIISRRGWVCQRKNGRGVTRCHFCSQNAHARKVLVGRAQWKINQPPSLEREQASLAGACISSDARSKGCLRTSAITYSATLGLAALLFLLGIIFWCQQTERPSPCTMPGLNAETRIDNAGERLGLSGQPLITSAEGAIIGSYEGPASRLFRSQ